MKGSSRTLVSYKRLNSPTAINQKSTTANDSFSSKSNPRDYSSQVNMSKNPSINEYDDHQKGIMIPSSHLSSYSKRISKTSSKLSLRARSAKERRPVEVPTQNSSP